MATLVDERNNVPSPTHPDEFLGDNAGMISSGPWCHGTFLLFLFFWLLCLAPPFFVCFFTRFGYAFLFKCKFFPPEVDFGHSRSKKVNIEDIGMRIYQFCCVFTDPWEGLQDSEISISNKSSKIDL